MKRIWLGVVLLVACGCDRRRRVDRDERAEPPPSVTRRVGEISAQLRSPDPAERADAIDQVRALVRRGVLTPDEGAGLLRRADQLEAVIGDAGVVEHDVQLALIDALADDPQLEYLAPLEVVGPSLRPAARLRAFDLLARLDDSRAARLFLAWLAAHPDDSPHAAFVTLRERQPQPEVMLPALLDLAVHPALFFDTLYTTLRYCEAFDQTPAPQLAGYGDWLVGSYRQRRDVLGQAQQATGTAWMWAPGYVDARAEAALLLDLLGFVAGEDASAALYAALDDRDPRLVYFAIEALTQRGEMPAPAVLERVAASIEMRGALHDRLAELGELAWFPARWRTQALLAESVMYTWLVNFQELGYPPRALELMQVVTLDADVEVGDAGAVETATFDYYVYRYQVDPAVEGAPEGWLAGVAGPFARDFQPTANDGDGTRSLYQPAASLTPEQHVAAVREQAQRELGSSD